MIKVSRIETDNELKAGIESLTSIFIEEYPYYSTWIEKNMHQFYSGEKQILKVLDNQNNQLLGYIMIHFSSMNIVKINGIYIFEENKGKGIATQALTNLCELLKQVNVDLIYVQTRLDNNAVVHLFDKTGFKLIGTNYHNVEQRNDWVACCNLNDVIIDEQNIAGQIYDGFTALDGEGISDLREQHKSGNLILRKVKKEDKKEN